MSTADFPLDLLGYHTPPPTTPIITPSSSHTAMSTRPSRLDTVRHSSYGGRDTMRRNYSSTSRRRHATTLPVSDDEAYTYCLRAAYLNYLLQPRLKRTQHVANTSKKVSTPSTSINALMDDFKLIRDSKSTRFPHGFMAELDKRITNVLIGKEKGAEYNDAMVKRTFATFLNELKQPQYRKQMEKDRRVEDLLLIFYSRATGELQKGKAPEDDTWKLMVDRHVALFVRLISSTLHNNDWTRERPELSSRLKRLETKLLQHDQDLTASTQTSAGTGGQSIEVEVPRSYEVRDMPLVIRVCSVFAKPTAQAQNDINAHRTAWTEQAALKDLKDYQSHMMLNTHVTLNEGDFHLDEAFEAWRRGEFADLGQMMLEIVKSDPGLAKTSTSGGVLALKAPTQTSDGAMYGDISRQMSAGAEADGGYALDQPVDMSQLNLDSGSPRDSAMGEQETVGFTFIPPDARAYYRQVVKVAFTHDLADEELAAGADGEPAKLLSRQSMDLLNEVALRWRIPQFTRLVLFLDVVREKYQHQEVPLETLDAAFVSVKEPTPEPVKKSLGGARPSSQPTQPALFDSSRWTVSDYALYQNLISTLHDALLRELFELFQHCYDAKPPSIGVIMYVLETHIYTDPLFSRSATDATAFTDMMADALRQKARDKYHELLLKNVSDNAAEWEFFNVIQLGQAVTGLCEKVKKRYRKNPEVMGVNPFVILVEEILPSFAADAKELVSRVMEVAKEKGEEVPILDGFELYKELVEIRRTHAQALPGREFGVHIEGLLQDFVWRFIGTTDAKIIEWIEGAVAHDDFQLRQDAKDKETGLPPTEEERHSQSPVDVYRIFNQSIDQIVKLEWDDDLQYAKFMTAVSKSIGKGVARYCELLETKFAKEMDRQTPEQESRSQQTQREKWVTAARDAWMTGAGGKGSGVKIEPFQFWPESLVKINDVEFATLQLDKLEQEINVDACAEVINRLDPPPAVNVRARGGGSKFMFTIKIIEAEDLKAGDANGSSDPYVVLGDEYQKRLAKTRTVYQSLNPRWDETVDILTTGPLNVIATVWDWDMLGDHDCLGRTSLKLDPSHFNDYLPREYWLDLDTQGRVLVRVSMEGERDDIQFYFGKAFRTLKRTERDMARKVTDKLSSYIQQCLSRRTLRALLTQGTLGGVSINQAKGYFSKLAGRPMGTASSATGATTPSGGLTPQDVSNALKPLLNYFDDNFAIMKQTLTDTAMITVMTRLWKEALVTLETLLVPPLSDKPSAQKPLGQQEVDIVYRWLQMLFDFFHAYDDDDKLAHGIPLDVLKSPKYHDLQNLNFFYAESTDNLIRTSDGIAQATARRQHDAAAKLHNRLSAPAATGPTSTHRLALQQQQSGGMSTSTGLNPSARRTKSIMMSRNLGTMRQAKEAKRAEAQADPSDDMILRILRMRPEAEKYLKDRSRQKERLAAAAAAEAIVRQSLMASRGLGLGLGAGGIGGGGGGGGGLVGAVAAGQRGRSGTAGAVGGLSRRWDTIRE
ncbi:hypothetical protein LTR33_009215 [Friedmanniomyces endolithicus]|nr:hypothetical protein LTR33_009215 [Friedmanniomyces endolithicus]